MGVPERIASVARQFLGTVGRVRGQGHPSFLGEGSEQVMDRGNLQSEARQCGCVGRMGVHDPSHVWLRTVETRVHRDLAGGLQGPFQSFAVEAYEHYVFGLQNVVGEATRGYQDVPLRGAGADVARGRGHETRGAHLASDPGYLSAQLSMFHVSSPSLIASAYDGVKVATLRGPATPSRRISQTCGFAPDQRRAPCLPLAGRRAPSGKYRVDGAVDTSGRGLRFLPRYQSPCLLDLGTSVAGGARRGGPLCDRLFSRGGIPARPKRARP